MSIQRLFVVLLGAVMVMTASHAQAATCTSLTKNLSRGSSGSEVRALQKFLVSRNYPGGGSWMISGYFGRATETAVQNFQAEQGLSRTGRVDAATRTAVSSVSCGYASDVYPTYTPAGMSVVPSYTYTPSVWTPFVNYFQTFAQEERTNASLYSLSKVSGAVGESVTIYGAGFTQEGNSVYFGKGVITNLRSTDGMTLSFIVPATLSGFGNETVGIGTYPIFVTNKHGVQSNSLSFAVTATAVSYQAPTISQVNGPTTLAVNTSGTWSLVVTAPSVSPTTLSVSWGDESVYPYSSQTTTQNVYNSGPQSITLSHTYTQPGTYTVTFRVQNASGQQSQATATVVVTGSTSSTPVTLSSVTPLNAQKGSMIVLTGANFTPTGNTIHFGIGGTKNITSVNGNTMYFTVPQYVSTCDLIEGYCGAPIVQVQPGAYPLYVTNANGQSQTLIFQVQ